MVSRQLPTSARLATALISALTAAAADAACAPAAAVLTAAQPADAARLHNGVYQLEPRAVGDTMRIQSKLRRLLGLRHTATGITTRGMHAALRDNRIRVEPEVRVQPELQGLRRVLHATALAAALTTAATVATTAVASSTAAANAAAIATPAAIAAAACSTAAALGLSWATRRGSGSGRRHSLVHHRRCALAAQGAFEPRSSELGDRPPCLQGGCAAPGGVARATWPLQRQHEH